MVHVEQKRNCFCLKCNIPASGKYIVRFGKDIFKRFSNYHDAFIFLFGLRFKTVEKTFDKRDYKKEQPLGFETQARKWLEVKQEQVKPSSWRNLRSYMNKAIDTWGQTNVKQISYGHIEDFLFSKKNFQNDKTRSNARSCLHDFFSWLKKREAVPIPDFPDCKYDLGRRVITSWDVQSKIIEEVKRICDEESPKVSFGIELLATYINLRPDDLRRIREEDFDPESGFIIIHNPTKRKNTFKSVRLTQEHKERWQAFRERFPGLPHVPFFRHTTGKGHRTNDGGFGAKIFWANWKRACANLGIENLDLYGGTRHTTATELSRIAGHDNTKKASGHLTNKAFDRYCQAEDPTAFEMAKIISKARDDKGRG